MRYAWINEKGGTLKTTLATHSAVYLAAFRGERTLLIDMDPQGQAGKSLGVLPAEDDNTIREVLLGQCSIRDAVLESGIEGLDIVPANKLLADAPTLLAAEEDATFRLKQALKGIRTYKNIVIDSPPSIGLLTRNILAACTHVCIPVNLSYLSLDGAAEMVQTVQEAKLEEKNSKLHVHKVVPTLYRRTRLADAVLERLQEHFGDTCAETRISISVKVDEAQSWGKTVWEYAPRTKASIVFRNLMSELYGPETQDGITLLRERE